MRYSDTFFDALKGDDQQAIDQCLREYHDAFLDEVHTGSIEITMEYGKIVKIEERRVVFDAKRAADNDEVPA